MAQAQDPKIVSVMEGVDVACFDPDKKAIDRFAFDGYRSVICLQPSDEKQALPVEDEERWVQTGNMAFVHIPVPASGIDVEHIDRFRAEIEAAPKPVLVHCASGKRSSALAVMHMGRIFDLTGAHAVQRAADLGLPCAEEPLAGYIRAYLDNVPGG